MRKYLSIMTAAMALSVTSGAFAADKLTFYCSAQEDWCQLMTKEFSAATGIKVNMTRKSSGETFAQIKAEAANPKENWAKSTRELNNYINMMVFFG